MVKKNIISFFLNFFPFNCKKKKQTAQGFQIYPTKSFEVIMAYIAVKYK